MTVVTGLGAQLRDGTVGKNEVGLLQGSPGEATQVVVVRCDW